MNLQKNITKKTIEFAGKSIELEVGRFAEQANASILGRYGDTMILTTVVSGGPREDLGYFPLFVEYQEKLYAGGRIKGSRWVKREGKPSDEAILNARLVDRSIRPLFPKEYTSETQVTITVLSVDAENDPDVIAIITASAALAISDIPWEGPIGALRVGFIAKHKNNSLQKINTNQSKKNSLNSKEGDFMFNPTYTERGYSDIDLLVSATKDAIVMVEASANEVKESTILDGFEYAQKEITSVIRGIQELVKEVGKKKKPVTAKEPNHKLLSLIKKHTKESFKPLDKLKKGKAVDIDLKAITQAVCNLEPDANKSQIKELTFNLLKEKVRDNVLKSGIRIDGRVADEIRPINIDVDILPRTHGSAMFKRGATQALTITTLAAPSLEQWIETMEGEGTKRYMHHYYMPPYSVGEVGRFGWPSRREIGHGALAERALDPMIPSEDEFPYTIRVVSEILSSNGSTSMASVCGSTLSLMDAGVPLKKPVSGIAMGLVVDLKAKSKNYAILSDILGIEDYIGDMDFKVAGTKDGITGIQMDVKIKGVSKTILSEALEQARVGRLYILSEMNKVLPAPRAQLSKYAPKVAVVKIDKEQIGDVIGPGGRVIREIIAETGTLVDVDDAGTITISGTESEGIRKAVDWVKSITRKVQTGEEFEGTVKRVQPFGAFVEILPGKEGLVHVSKLSSEFVSDPNQVVSVGDKLKVKVEEIDDLGRINLIVPGVQKAKRYSQDRARIGKQNFRNRPPRRSRRG